MGTSNIADVEYRDTYWICGCDFVGRKPNPNGLDRVEKCRLEDGTVWLGVFDKCKRRFRRITDNVWFPCSKVEVAILNKVDKK